MKLHRSRRSSAEWAVRIASALATASIGYFAVTTSLAEVVRRSDPAQAHDLAPGDGRITAHLAEQAFKKRPSGDIHSVAARLARLAVRQDATAVSAITTLAAQAQLRGDTREARRLATYSQLLSRRDLQTQLWFIEDAVSRNDVPGALHHYDIALRTSRAASALLYPVLAQALAEPEVRANLVTTMTKKPAWGPTFLAYALGGKAAPRDLADLFYGMRAAGAPVAPEASASLIGRLLLHNAPEDAWRYYASLRTGLDQRRSRDPRFSADPASPSQFDWLTAADDDLAVSIQRSGSGGVVDFSVPSGRGGVLLSQAQMLPPGEYRFSGEGHGIDQPDVSLPYWTLSCRDGRELGRIVVPRSLNGASTFTGQFIVPSDCRSQVLALIARPTDSVAGFTGQISRAELVPAG